MKSSQIYNLCIMITFLSFSFCLWKFFQINSVIENTSPVEYYFISKKEVKGGRGSYYIMSINYNNDIKTIHITSKEFENLNYNVKPKVFYNRSNKSFLTSFSRLIYMRFSLLIFLILFILLIFKNTKIKSYFT